MSSKAKCYCPRNISDVKISIDLSGPIISRDSATPFSSTQSLGSPNGRTARGRLHGDRWRILKRPVTRATHGDDCGSYPSHFFIIKWFS